MVHGVCVLRAVGSVPELASGFQLLSSGVSSEPNSVAPVHGEDLCEPLIPVFAPTGGSLHDLPPPAAGCEKGQQVHIGS